MGIYVCRFKPMSLLDFKNHPPWYMLSLALSVATAVPPRRAAVPDNSEHKAREKVSEYRDVHV